MVETEAATTASAIAAQELIIQQAALAEQAKEAALQETALATSLKEATAAEIATTAIGLLGDALDEGKITADEYRTAVTETQLAFGLADEASINLTERLLGLTERFAEGTVSATAFDEELAFLVQLNETENLQLEKFGELLGTSTEAMASATTTAGGTTASMDDLGQATSGAKTEVSLLGGAIADLPDTKVITIKVEYDIAAAPAGLPSNVPQFQAGTAFAPGGVALVGEQGPELAFIPRGSQVMNAQRTSQVTNNLTMNVTSNGTPGAAMADFELMRQLVR